MRKNTLAHFPTRARAKRHARRTGRGALAVVLGRLAATLDGDARLRTPSPLSPSLKPWFCDFENLSFSGGAGEKLSFSGASVAKSCLFSGISGEKLSFSRGSGGGPNHGVESVFSPWAGARANMVGNGPSLLVGPLPGCPTTAAPTCMWDMVQHTWSARDMASAAKPCGQRKVRASPSLPTVGAIYCDLGTGGHFYGNGRNVDFPRLAVHVSAQSLLLASPLADYQARAIACPPPHVC